MRRGRFLACSAVLGVVLNYPPALGEPQPSPARPAPPAVWLEVTPLASFDAVTVLRVPPGRAPVSLANPAAGLALVCFGGKEIAVACRQRYLPQAAKIDPEVERGVRLAGAVYVGEEPARGARVALVPKELRSRRFVTLPLRREEEDGPLVREIAVGKDGRFETPEIAPGDYRLEVKPPGGQIYHGEPFTVPPREALLPKGQAGRKPGAVAMLDLGRIDFDKGVAVEVFAHSVAGEPLGRVKTGGSQGRTRESTRFFETETGPDGKATVAGLDGLVPVHLVCVAPGFQRYEEQFDVPPSSFDCALEPRAALQGTVATGEGKPVAGATVHLPGAQRQTVTGEDGRFELSDLAAGDYRLVVAAPGFRLGRAEATLAPGEKRKLPTIELLAASEIECLVRDARLERPIAGASLSSLDPPGLVAATTDAEGRCRFALDEEGPVKLTITAEGYPETRADLDPAKLPEEGPWTVELKPGGRILARVWDEESDGPCQGCTLTVQGGSGYHRLITDGRGEALSEALAEGNYSVSLERVQSYGSVVQVESGNDNKEATVRSGEISTVQFGEPGRLLRVRLRPPPPEDWVLWAFEAGGVRHPERVEPGLFELRRPGAGPVVLELSLASGTAAVRLAGLSEDDHAGVIDIELPQTELRGALATPDGALGGTRIEFVSADRGEVAGRTVSSADGRFRLPYLPSGTYSALVSGKPVRSFQIAPGEALDLGTLLVASSPAR